MTGRRRSLALCALTGLGLAFPEPARAQSPETWETRAWMGDVAFLGLNSLVGGLTAGVLQTLRDGSFQDGFARGALGGAISYGGRRLAVEDFAGAGLLGRQTSAVGASLVRNASEGRPSLARVSLPLGPVILRVDGTSPVRVRPEIDAFATVWLLSALADDRLHLDGGATLSAGAPVFRTPGHRLGQDGVYPDGKAIAGLVLLGYGADDLPGHDVFAHERVHVLQYDFQQEIWGDPLESWIARRLRVGRVSRFVRPGVAYPLLKSGITDLLDLEWDERIWEIEAEFLEHR